MPNLAGEFPYIRKRVMAKVPLHAKIGAAALHEPNALGQRRRRGIFLGRTMQKIKSSVGATHSQTMRGAVRGPPDTGEKSPFLCHCEGEVLWGNPPLVPWRVGSRSSADFADGPGVGGFKGIITRVGTTTLMYEVAVGKGKTMRVRESPRCE